ncbi:MAG TPA: PASTA domain-containing protein, partial [Micromonospora sp.]
GVTTGAARVPLPPLAGLPQAGAQALLDRLGLGYQLRFEPSDRPAGTIVRTDPPAGTLVERGDEIILVIAEEPAPPTGPPPTGEPTAPPATG